MRGKLLDVFDSFWNLQVNALLHSSRLDPYFSGYCSNIIITIIIIMFCVCCEDVYECEWVCGSHSVTSHLTSWHRICHQTWSSSIWPKQLARKLRRFSCFHSPNTGVTGICCYIWIFMWVLEIQTLVPMFCHMHFADWALSPVLQPYYYQKRFTIPMESLVHCRCLYISALEITAWKNRNKTFQVVKTDQICLSTLLIWVLCPCSWHIWSQAPRINCGSMGAPSCTHFCAPAYMHGMFL